MLSLLSHYIEFPNLGWKFSLNDTLVQFQLFGTTFTIKWYGVLIAIGFLLAVMYGLQRAKEFDVDPDKMIDAALLSTLMGFIGARLYYVFFSEDTAAYLADPLSILEIWNGGLGIYGGIIFAFAFGFLFCKLLKLNFLSMCDLASLGFLIGQAIGRWGNFFNQEAFGTNTNLPWAMTGDIIASGLNGAGYDTSLPVHPTFLYESLWCILGFVLLHILSKKLYRFKGQIFCSYLIWYGVGRFAIESLRTDSLMAGTIRTSQLVAILAIIGGGILFLVLRRRAQALPKTLEELAPADSILPVDEDEADAEEETADEEESEAEPAQDTGEDEPTVDTAGDAEESDEPAEEPTGDEEETTDGDAD